MNHLIVELITGLVAALLVPIFLGAVISVGMSAAYIVKTVHSEDQHLGLKFFGLLLNLWSINLKPSVPDGTEFNVVEDYSLFLGEYKCLNSNPVGVDAKQKRSDEGVILEVTDEDHPNSKFVMQYESEEDLVQEIEVMLDSRPLEENENDEVAQRILGGEDRDCWMCGDEVSIYTSQDGDELRQVLPFLGYCSTATGDIHSICGHCTLDLYKKVINGDNDIINGSDVVRKKI